jgi:hypothetical protein
MSAERKVDLEAALAALIPEVELALKQGVVTDGRLWQTPATGPDDAPWVVTLTVFPRRPPFTKVTVKALVDTVFEALGDQGERDRNKFVIPSGYGAGGIIIDVQDIAVALLEGFDIREHRDG